MLLKLSKILFSVPTRHISRLSHVNVSCAIMDSNWKQRSRRKLHFLHVSPFSLKHVFSTNEVFEQLSVKKDPFDQIIRKRPPKGNFIIFWRNILVRTLVYEVVYSCSFEFLRTFFEKICEVWVLRSSFY